ncbi:MAG: hypothetical protein QXV17_14620 [Candidatus Micrarchaeaceae archaeon]
MKVVISRLSGENKVRIIVDDKYVYMTEKVRVYEKGYLLFTEKDIPPLLAYDVLKVVIERNKEDPDTLEVYLGYLVSCDE